MKIFRTLLKIAGLLVTAAVIAGCSVPHQGADGAFGTVYLTVDGTQEQTAAARTVLPDSAGSLAYTAVSGEVTETLTGGSGSMRLPLGPQTITITARNGATAVGSATVTHDVKSGANTVPPVYLVPASGNGTFAWNVTFPAGVTVTEASIARYADRAAFTGDAPIDTADLAAAGSGTTANVAAGAYYVAAKAKDDEDGTAMLFEMVHVYPGMTTTFVWEPAAGEFKNTVTVKAEADITGLPAGSHTIRLSDGAAIDAQGVLEGGKWVFAIDDIPMDTEKLENLRLEIDINGFNTVSKEYDSVDIDVFGFTADLGAVALHKLTLVYENGTVTVEAAMSGGIFADTAYIAAGDEVTVSATGGFERWDIAGLSGYNPTDNPLTFAMPGNDITVTADISPLASVTLSFPRLDVQPWQKQGSLVLDMLPGADVTIGVTVLSTVPANTAYEWGDIVYLDTASAGNITFDKTAGKVTALASLDAATAARATVTVTSDEDGIAATLLIRVHGTGDGSQDSPWILDKGLLLTLAAAGDTTDYYLQMDDIDMSGETVAGGVNWFEGQWNGNGYAVKDLTVTGRGLFAGTGTKTLFDEDATPLPAIRGVNLKTLTLDTAYTGGDGVGAISGQNYGIIEYSSVSGTVNAPDASAWVGGITGRNYCDGANTGIIRYCYSEADVTGKDTVGGIAGESTKLSTAANYARIENCYATGDITASDKNGGGIAGNFGENTNNVYTTGSVTVVSGDHAGGIIGNGIPSNNVDPSGSNWVALGPSVSGAKAFRVASGTPVSETATIKVDNAYARSDMEVNGAPITDGEAKDGTGITSAQWDNAGWWQGTAGFDSRHWIFTNGSLPILRGFPAGQQNPQIKN